MYRHVYFCAISIVTALALAIVAASEAANRPKYGSWGFDTEGEDSGVKPGDDFFAFANGTWVKNTLIPADKSRIFLLSIVSDSTEERLRGMMERAAGETTRQPRDLRLKMGAFYKAFMNDARVEQLGARPIGSQLAAVRAAVTREKLAVLMGRNRSDFEGTLFQFYVDSDLKNPTQYALHIGQGGLGLPDRDYYLTSNFSAQKTSYERYAARLLSAVGWPGAASRAKEIVELETRIAEASWSKTQQRDPAAVYNPVAVAELEKFAPDFAWDEFLKSLGIPRPPRLIVLEKSAVPKLAAIFAQTPVPTLQAWQAFQIADDAAPYLSHDFALAWFELHEKSLGGQLEQRARWKRGITAVSGGDFGNPERFGTFGTMGFGVGEVYLGKYFGPKAMARIETLVSQVKAAFRVRLEGSDWMGPQTKAEALKKLDTYDIKVAGPVHPRDYYNLVIRDDDLVGDVQRAGAADWAFYSGRISAAVDRTEWKMTPQTADAYTTLTLRDVVFPAGFLQPPVFDPEADTAVNYGAIGAIIGHELTHGFDDQGRKMDASGELRNWWSKTDAQTFDDRARKLGLQYSAFEPLPGIHVNGDLTMGENLADLGGLSIALDAWRASLKGNMAPILDGFTGEQRVFLGYAQIWRSKSRDDALRRQLVSNPHAPGLFRTNVVVRNLDAWYDAFGVKPDDKLYISPGERVRIW